MRPNIILVIFAIYINITNGLNLQIIRGVKEIDIINAVKKYMTGKKGLIYDLKTQNKIINTLRRRTALDDKDLSNEKKLKNFDNKVLVKRIIPHGYAGGKYDYDSKFNTLYKPLVRVHKTRAVKDDNSDFMNKEFTFDRLNFEPNKDSKDKYTLIFMLKNSKDINPSIHDESNVNIFSKSALLKPFDLKIPNSELITDDLNEGNQDINKDKASRVVKKEKLNTILKNGDIIRLNSTESTNIANKEIYNIILGILGKKKRDKLRANMLITKSAEEEEEYRPPKYLFHVSEEESNGKKPSMQHYPYWNYWTYDKGLYMDTCKGNLINVGGVCVGKSR
ncbi:hypothetical protein K1T71_012897 [Dendrolimus kikuchii]|uniref:Uncharacterized protein n=1 Tax=Dendrolimus kikuchii TaxID=765133 RepID=A0ACC1CIF2_9NEOP|nr:hypothetical protein K1T71_012897 [Dendrolimus kikuchii]